MYEQNLVKVVEPVKHTTINRDKYILTSWVLFNRAEQIYGAPKS